MDLHDDESRTPMNIVSEMQTIHSTADSVSISNGKAALYTLPIEILALIFDECACSSCEPKDRRQCTFALSQITRHLRDVALQATPSLWSRIEHNIGRETDLSMTAAYLERSNGSLLELDLRLETNHDNRLGLAPVLDMIIPHVLRWKAFRLSGSVESGLTTCIDRLSALRAPNLASLCIHLNRWDYDSIPVLSNSTVFSSGTPRLAFVQIHGLPPQCCRLSLTSVRQLQIKGVIESETYQVTQKLSTLSNLLHLTHLNIDDSIIYDWSTPSTLYLPALTTLALCSDVDYGFLPGMILSLKAPLLQRLILEGIHRLDAETLFAESDLALPSRFPALHSLAMGVVGSGFCWDEFPTLFPHITDFTLMCLGVNLGLFHILSELEQSALLGWQDLHTCTMTLSGGRESMDTILQIASVLLKVLRKRKEAGYPIKILRICQSMVESIAQMDCMAELDLLVDGVQTSGSGLLVEAGSRLVDNLWLDPVSVR